MTVSLEASSASPVVVVPVTPSPKVRRKRTKKWKCGFCSSGAHRSCPGAVENGQRGLLLCACTNPDCLRPPRCLVCNLTEPDEVDQRRWRCLDRSACAVRVELRKQNNYLWQKLQACRVSGVNARRARRELAERLKAEIGDEMDEFERPLEEDQNRRRTQKRTASPRPCDCGCSGVTRGGLFLPGHDAKLKSSLHKDTAAGDESARAELERRGWLK